VDRRGPSGVSPTSGGFPRLGSLATGRTAYAAHVANVRSSSGAVSLPVGTLTFLFTDIEGSTRLVTALGPAFGPLLERHQAILRAAFESAGGIEISTEGDAFFVVFPSAAEAVTAAAAAQRSLRAEAWPTGAPPVRVRMGIHTGEAVLGGDNYVGLDLHRAARIAAAAHGGQVLVSATTAALVARSLPGDLRLRELGEFRLKDLEAPERLAQLVGPDLVDDFPPPRTLETPSNLPAQMTSFVGRERELAEVCDLVRTKRLVTLTGPGGAGKTRLSLRVAEQLRPEYLGGAFFVELEDVRDASLVPTTIAEAIGLREDPKRPAVEVLEAHLRDLRLLLIADNFEQVVAAAPLVGRLLGAAPNLTVLASSREALHLRGEQEYPVPSLAAPDPAALPPVEALAKFDAVALFVQRARAVRPEFEVDEHNAAAVAAICARLDGLPLAIELAAARSKLFEPVAILARLDKSLALLASTARDVPERQRTLHGAIGWSHDLLDPSERSVFRRLAVFVGGCTIDAATAVCDPDGELDVDVLDILASLVDKSLLTLSQGADGEPRFVMLETIRGYALERLAESGEAEPVRRRHEDHFAKLALEAEPQLLGAHPNEWLDRLEAERDNLRAAIQRAADDGRIELALDTAAALWRFWQQRGHLAEGRDTLRALLEQPGATAPTRARARGLGGLGGVTYWQADMASAGRAYDEAVEIERGLDDPSGLAEALYNAGYVSAIAGDRDRARAEYDEAIGIYEAMGDRKGLLRVRDALAFILIRTGDLGPARTIQEENLATFRVTDERLAIEGALTLLTVIDLKDRAFAAAHARLRETIAMVRAAGDMQRLSSLLTIGAALAIAEGDPERAARLSGAASVILEPLGSVATPMQLIGLDDPVPAARAALGNEAFEAAYAAGRALDVDAAVSLADGAET
jgi:predicted ATPase/class 3 adenylate cyclase